MRELSVIKLDLDNVIVTLFCCYAFSMPFELILETLLGIDTILKPFRFLSLVIIGVFGIKVIRQGFSINKKDYADLFLYGVFIYGLLISCWRIITGVFDMDLFINDSFQFSLLVATYFVYKSTPISNADALKIFKWFIIGISCNAFYILSIFFLNIFWERQAGFTDNPNYASLGIVAATTFLILRTNFIKNKTQSIGILFLILFLLYIFGIQGSRAGFIMFMVANIFIFFFSHIRRKITIMITGMVILFLLTPGETYNSTLIGEGPRVLINRLNKSVNDGGEDVRFVVWRGVFTILEDTGYAGMGIGQFKANFPKYFVDESNNLIVEMVNYGYFLSTHNDYLAILTDYGLPSLIFYLIFISITLSRLFKSINLHRVDKEKEFLVQYSFIFFACVIIFGLAAENFQHQLFWFLLMFTSKNYDYSLQ